MRPSHAAVLLCTAWLSLGCAKPSPSGVSLDGSIREPSGLTASPQYDGVFWVDGDSGAGNWLFAVNREGERIARLRVKGAINVDWEDLTHDDQGNLWLGDIGNNDSSRRDLAVHRIPEPDPHAKLDRVHVDLSVRYSFPEQVQFGNKQANFDAESLLWWGDELWLLTKHRSDDLTRLYRFPELSGAPVELELTATFDLGTSLTGTRKPWSGQATAAEAAPNGEHWALLTYDAVFVFELPESGVGAELFAKPVNRIAFDMAKTRQVEGLAWDGPTLVVANEERHLFRIDDPLTAVSYP